MKRLTLVLAVTIITAIGYGQKIEENKVDDFTKNSVIRTSFEVLSRSGFNSYCRINKINQSYYLQIRVMNGSVLSVRFNSDVMFKMSNDSIISLKVMEGASSCIGCGAIGFLGSASPGIDFQVILTSEEIEQFKSLKVKKVRIYTIDGYIEAEVKEKFSDIIAKELNLFK